LTVDLDRFDKKNETEKTIWGEVIWLFYFLPVFCRFLTFFLSTQVAELMKSNVVTVTGELCSVKWKSMKERYNEINEKLKKVKEWTQTSGRRSQ
jgi:cobalamin biosynthesis protein CobD/CbiB